MAYDFSSFVDRRGTACVKWDAPNGAGVPAGDVIPMWVADMDFRTAPCIIDALRKRVLDHRTRLDPLHHRRGAGPFRLHQGLYGARR